MTILLSSWDKEYEVSGCSHTDTTNLVAQREVPSLRITVQTEERSPAPERSTTTFPVLEKRKREARSQHNDYMRRESSYSTFGKPEAIVIACSSKWCRVTL